MNISFLTRDPTANVYISSCYRYFREATCFFLSRFKGSARLTFLDHTHTRARSLTRTTPRFIFENSLASQTSEQERERERETVSQLLFIRLKFQAWC